MKKLIVLIALVFWANLSIADTSHQGIIAKPQFEIVDVPMIMQLGESMEMDSNLVFTVSRFTYYGLNDIDLNLIIEDLANDFWPTHEKLIITYSETHNAYDEELSLTYSGKIYIAITQTGEETEFSVFCGNPKKITRSEYISSKADN